MAADCTASAQCLQLMRLVPRRNITHSQDAAQATSPLLPHNPGWGLGTQLSYMIEAIGFLRSSTYQVNPINALELSQ